MGEEMESSAAVTGEHRQFRRSLTAATSGKTRLEPSNTLENDQIRQPVLVYIHDRHGIWKAAACTFDNWRPKRTISIAKQYRKFPKTAHAWVAALIQHNYVRIMIAIYITRHDLNHSIARVVMGLSRLKRPIRACQ
jgi:hypothetical protein